MFTVNHNNKFDILDNESDSMSDSDYDVNDDINDNVLYNYIIQSHHNVKPVVHDQKISELTSNFQTLGMKNTFKRQTPNMLAQKPKSKAVEKKKTIRKNESQIQQDDIKEDSVSEEEIQTTSSTQTVWKILSALPDDINDADKYGGFTIKQPRKTPQQRPNTPIVHTPVIATNATSNIAKTPNVKYRMCQNLQNCKFGSRCSFAHSYEQLEPKQCRWDMRCSNQACTFKHSNETNEEWYKRKQ